MPGPSTADPVVKECRNPMSPRSSAVRTSDSGTSLPKLTRSSKGLSAPSGGTWMAGSGTARLPVEGSADDILLLVSREADEVDRVARYANRQAGVLLRMLHRVHERLAVQDVHVHVVPGDAEE